MTETNISVLIIGGGTVGLHLAMELGWRNVDCLLVNQRHSTPDHPKGSTINSRSMEHLRRLGIASEIRKAGLPPDHITDICYVTRLAEWELGRIHMPTSREKICNPGPWGPTELTPEPIHRCNQFYFEKIMRAHAESLASTDLRFHWQLNSFEDRGDHVRAEIENLSSGRTETVIYEYMVGCDGGRGNVRRQLGITYQGRESSRRLFYDGEMLSIYVHAPDIADIRRMPVAWHYWTINPKGRVDFITLDGKGDYVLLAEVEPGVSRTEIDVRGIVQNAISAETPFDVISVQEWTAGLALVEDHYQRGRGLRAEHETFKEEFASLGIVLGARYDGSPLIVGDGTSPPRDDRARYTPSACPGGRAPHYWIEEKHSLYDRPGPDFNLLRSGPDAPDADPLTMAADRLGVPLTVVTVAEPGILELYEQPLALVRPDQHVAWRGAVLPDNPDVLLKTVASLRP